MQSKMRTVTILGTGGTIAGTAATSADNIGYRAAQLSVEQLVAAVPALAKVPLSVHQVAQVDSKDMSFEIWTSLALEVAHQLERRDVAGVVITHGTDTLEETAYMLQRVLAPTKPVVLTAAMRPATALMADGPQNILDAVAVASEHGASGVVAVMAGTVYSAFDVRKAHTYRMDAFSAGDAGPIGYVEEGRVRLLRDWPRGDALGLATIYGLPGPWPRVEIVASHAGADGAVVQALRSLGVHGLVVVATGNGTIHHDLETALLAAQDAGVKVLRVSRCAEGPVLAKPGDALPSAGSLTPAKARVALMLELMATRS